MNPRTILLCLTGFAALACAPVAVCHSAPGPADVANSWKEAVVYLPGRTFTTTVRGIEIDKPVPVVLHMHGCAGIHDTDKSWAYFLKEQGYAVILPDSFARDRPPSCDPRTKRTGLFPGALSFRKDEIVYALEQIKAAPWADKRNLFLMGHSQGGVLVALAGIPGFRGVIISGWPCVGPGNSSEGLRVPDESPVLVLNHERDPWYGYAADRRCSEFFGERKNAREVILKGFDHDSFKPAAKEAVLEFLNENLSR